MKALSGAQSSTPSRVRPTRPSHSTDAATSASPPCAPSLLDDHLIPTNPLVGSGYDAEEPHQQQRAEKRPQNNSSNPAIRDRTTRPLCYCCLTREQVGCGFDVRGCVAKREWEELGRKSVEPMMHQKQPNIPSSLPAQACSWSLPVADDDGTQQFVASRSGVMDRSQKSLRSTCIRNAVPNCWVAGENNWKRSLTAPRHPTLSLLLRLRLRQWLGVLPSTGIPRRREQGSMQLIADWPGTHLTWEICTWQYHPILEVNLA